MTISPAPMQTGQLIDDRYRILSHLGTGGMGAVYVAEQIKLNRNIALKMLRPEVADHDLAAKRFEREAQAVSTIDHPNVIRVLDFGELVMGRDLAQLLTEDGRLPWARAQRFIRQLVRGLGAAHASGIIHRDIKPGSSLARPAEPEAPELTAPPPVKPKPKLPAVKVEVTFVAGDLEAVEIKIAGQTAMLEPVKTLRVPVGQHEVLYRKQSADELSGSEPWTKAGTIEIAADKSYRAQLRAQATVLLTEKG